MPQPVAPGVSWQPTQAPATAFPAAGLSATPTGQVAPTAWNPAVTSVPAVTEAWNPAQSTYHNPSTTSQTFPPPYAVTSVPATQQMPAPPYGTSPVAGPKYS
jgi:hypothetical protein